MLFPHVAHGDIGLSTTNGVLAMETTMTPRKCWLLVVAGLCFLGFCTPQQIGTTAVHWTLYSGLSLSWNEASSFCKFLGGHLPVLNTKIKWNGFRETAVKWANSDQLTDDVWTGLFTQAPFTYPKLWEADCSVQPDNRTFWGAGEPDYTDTDLCARYKPSPQRLYTWNCKSPYSIVCEFDKGSCGQRLGSIPSALLKSLTLNTLNFSSSTMKQSCWQQCMDYPPTSSGGECVAATFTSEVCETFVGETLVSTTNTTPILNNTMLKDCFDNDINSSYSNPIVVDKSDKPRPAGDPCGTDLTTSTSILPTTDVTTNGFSSEVTSSIAGPHPLLCPCLKTQTFIAKLPIVHRNTTSKYRRSLNSQWGSPDTYTSTSSATFVVVVGLAGFLFVVCDINRFARLCGKNRHGTVKTMSS